MLPPNRNLLWADLFVDELARCGLKAVSIAPGSRSTPLVMAFAAHPDIQVYSHVDERSASFFALGLALATARPVALLCSSGTAASNFHPAVTEARYAAVPLLVLTADRPPEVRESGANQTVDQIRLFGDHVLWSVDVALPEASPPGLALRNLRTLAARAYAKADGLPRGPVHLNFPFRKPLEPTPVPTDVTTGAGGEARGNHRPFTAIARGTLTPTAAQIAALAAVLTGVSRGMIFCGPRSPGGDFPQAVARLAQAAGFLLLADALSGARFGAANDSVPVIGGYDTFLQGKPALEPPDVILHFGAIPTSQALDDFLNIPGIDCLWVSADGVWPDANHRADTLLWADPAQVCDDLVEQLADSPPAPDTVWQQSYFDAEAATWRAVDSAADTALFDGAVLARVTDLLPENGKLFVANSLPVRHLDQFARPTRKNLRVFCNRGASGIDGTVSSALGVSAADGAPTVLVTGDLAFYHDMNGLLAVKRSSMKATFVVINNDGGGIFERLPVAKFDPPFTELFLTPHGLDFAPVAQLYGLDYAKVQTPEAFDAAFAQALASDRAALIEVPSDYAADAARRQQMIENALSRASSPPSPLPFRGVG